MIKQEKDSEELAASLESFIKEIHRLEIIDERLNLIDKSFNVFDILVNTRKEDVHSRFLAWIFSPNGNHGAGEAFLANLLRFCANETKVRGIIQSKIIDESLNLSIDTASFVVHREWAMDSKRVDLLVVSDKEKIVITIENKIGATEHGDQLDNYRKIIDKEYPDYLKIYLFLTVGKKQSSDPLNWDRIGYVDIKNIIKDVLEKNFLDEKPKFFVENYLDILEGYILVDGDLVKQAREIYAKHLGALNHIMEFGPVPHKRVDKLIGSWLEEKVKEVNSQIIYRSEDNHYGYYRFETSRMNKIFTEKSERNIISGVSDDGWLNNLYFFEIFNNHEKDSVYMKLTFYKNNFPLAGRDDFGVSVAEKLKFLETYEEGVFSNEKHYIVLYSTADENELVQNGLDIKAADLDISIDSYEVGRRLDLQFEKLRAFEDRFIENYNKHFNK